MLLSNLIEQSLYIKCINHKPKSIKTILDFISYDVIELCCYLDISIEKLNRIKQLLIIKLLNIDTR